MEYDNAPDWLVANMHYRRTISGNTPQSIMTFFLDLRQFFKWRKLTLEGQQPHSAEELQEVDILDLPLSVAAEVKKSDIEGYLYFLSDILNNGPGTRNKKLVSIRTFYDWMLDQQAELGVTILANPADRIRRPKQPKKEPVYLPQEDQIALLEGVSGRNSVRDYAILLTLTVTGMRLAELCSIDLDNLNLKEKTIRVMGKGQKERLCYLTDAAAKAIQRYILEYRDLILGLDSPALFVSSKNKDRLTKRAVEKLMQKHTLNAELGGKGYTPHKLRHTTATTLARSGVGIMEIQEVLGHANPTTTRIYTHLGQDDVAKAVHGSMLKELGNK